MSVEWNDNAPDFDEDIRLLSYAKVLPANMTLGQFLKLRQIQQLIHPDSQVGDHSSRLLVMARQSVIDQARDLCTIFHDLPEVQELKFAIGTLDIAQAKGSAAIREAPTDLSEAHWDPNLPLIRYAKEFPLEMTLGQFLQLPEILGMLSIEAVLESKVEFIQQPSDESINSIGMMIEPLIEAARRLIMGGRVVRGPQIPVSLPEYSALKRAVDEIEAFIRLHTPEGS